MRGTGIGNGNGYGDGYGTGDGNGDGYGTGHGTGNGYGDGYGYSDSCRLTVVADPPREPEEPVTRTTITELAWTRPSPFCPKPHLWHAPDPDSAEDEVADFVWGIVRALQPELIVETGTAHGRTAERICDALEDNGHGRLVTIEYDQARAAAAHARLAGRPVTVLASRSLDTRLDATADLLFSDSDPSIRVDEVLHFAPEWFILHDTAPHHPWADRLAGDLAANVTGDYDLLTLPTPRGVTVGRRT